ncbi:phytoene/squalene synthase family protein [Aquamicrobium sp. LC103]|uniref:phytoene/squalene synthase family protein n=1 Tax=Aquamicrobium sp. LC103 TaxID=1120658 RepID=UPI00063EB979|nr:phytoene/squalene synthase family protein [Aquamicrobium sp. LC103]TKT76779.1 phytoene/squalene synthase family protein [Aquamicrobium sp. LC103]
MGEPSSLAEAVRRDDPDRYLSALYAPEARREALFALYAFNVEIASVRDRIHEPLPGEIRLQWWRDILAAGKGAAAGHPVAEALSGVIERSRLPLATFQNYLDARIFDLYDDPMPSRNDLEGYCGETASAIIQLAALILDPEAAPEFAEAAGHAGCAQAMAGLLRLLPMHRARGQCFMPEDILAAAGTSRDEFVAGENRDAAMRAVVALSALAGEHLARFEKAANGMPVSLRPAFLPASLAGAYLARISARGVDPLTQIADISPLRRHWTLLRRALLGWR